MLGPKIECKDGTEVLLAVWGSFLDRGEISKEAPFSIFFEENRRVIADAFSADIYNKIKGIPNTSVTERIDSLRLQVSAIYLAIEARQAFWKDPYNREPDTGNFPMDLFLARCNMPSIQEWLKHFPGFFALVDTYLLKIQRREKPLRKGSRWWRVPSGSDRVLGDFNSLLTRSIKVT